jgi:hypothetical protein
MVPAEASAAGCKKTHYHAIGSEIGSVQDKCIVPLHKIGKKVPASEGGRYKNSLHTQNRREGVRPKVGVDRLFWRGNDAGLVGIDRQRRSLLNFHILSVLDQADGPE